MDVVELEIGLHRREAGIYTVELRVTLPGSEAETRVTARFAAAKIDFDGLRREKFDAEAHARLLTDCLFSGKELRNAFDQARAVAEAKDMALRLRLFVGPSAPELHGLFWESLRDPADGITPLFTGERILFSRYLTSADWRPVRRRARSDLRALLAVANPSDLATWQPGGRKLTPIDVQAELARARAGLQGIRCEELNAGGRATLDRLVLKLREGCDVLYLVCHGAVIDGEPWLWLEDATGESHRVCGTELVQRIRGLHNLPALVILASCESAVVDGEACSTEGGVLAALGPGLAEAGVPAVLAMQADVAMATMAGFMPVFFTELKRDGQIDRAVAAARGAVGKRLDWYVPVLYMRLRGGALWYNPGFEEKFEKWPSVVGQAEGGEWTPILGPGLTDSLLGSRREVAQRWADTFRFPMAPHDREDLPQVAQYLSIQQDAVFPQKQLIDYLRSELLVRYRDDLPADVRNSPAGEVPAAHLSRLISSIGAQRRQRDPTDSFKVLADLPLPIYITASQSDLITDALREAGKEPHIDFCRWNDATLDVPRLDPVYRPDSQHPLVYHLFGRLDHPQSLVITEDDYFDFLIGMKKNKELIPLVVKAALAAKGLLFLGFHLNDLNFRIMCRAIMDQEGSQLRRRRTKVAAQIDLEEGRILEPRGARAYLERYFDLGSNISIYWGSPDDFVAELNTRLKLKAAAA